MLKKKKLLCPTKYFYSGEIGPLKYLQKVTESQLQGLLSHQLGVTQRAAGDVLWALQGEEEEGWLGEWVGGDPAVQVHRKDGRACLLMPRDTMFSEEQQEQRRGRRAWGVEGKRTEEKEEEEGKKKKLPKSLVATCHRRCSAPAYCRISC